MADLARHLGLARSTVSMALRRHPEISQATSDRVLRAARELGYRPNPLIAALMASLQGGRHAKAGSVIAVIDQHPHAHDWRKFVLFEHLWAGMSAQSSKLGYTLQPFNIGKGGLSPARLATVLRTRGINGAVLAPVPHAGASAYRDWSELATATVNWSMSEPPVHRALTDYFHNACLAWDTLRTRGFKRIGFVYCWTHSVRIHDGFLGGYLARNLRLPPSERVEPLVGETLDHVSVDALRAWYRREKPDAVLCTEATVTIPRLAAIARVPEELSVASLELGSSPPDTAGIDERSDRVGASALDLVVAQLHRNERGLPAVPVMVHVPGEWRDGATVRR